MNLSYRHLLNLDFSPASRVWVYQASRPFSISEALQIEDLLKDFTMQWQSHGEPVKGAGYLFFGQFIILMSDESETTVSGCSTDSSVRFIKMIQEQLHVELFDRTMLAFIIKDKIQLLPMAQLIYAVENNFIDPETLYFNNTVQTKAEMESNWIIPVKESWLAKKIAITQ